MTPPLSASIHDPLARAFAEGHRAPITDLMSDAAFAIDGRATPAAVLIAVTDVRMIRRSS